MQRTILRALIVCVALASLAFLLVMPHFEGRNVGADWVTVYFRDPFLLFAYASSIPFFVALYQAYTVLGGAADAARRLRLIKTCGHVMAALVVVGVVWLLSQESDDRPPIVAMGTLGLLVSLGISGLASRAGKRLRS